MPIKQTERGFTLIELLVVMGIIVVLVGGTGFARRSNSASGVALQSAQTELAWLLGATRAQAVLHQTSARLLVYATPPPTGEAAKYLRCLQIVREEPSDSGQWNAVSDPIYLPSGIFIVPPVVSATHLVAGLTWPGGQFAPVSTLLGPDGVAVGGSDFGEAYYVEYNSDGRADPAVTKLAMATAQPSRDSFPRFDNPDAVRGIRLRPAGTIATVNAAGDF